MKDDIIAGQKAMLKRLIVIKIFGVIYVKTYYLYILPVNNFCFTYDRKELKCKYCIYCIYIYIYNITSQKSI